MGESENPQSVRAKSSALYISLRCPLKESFNSMYKSCNNRKANERLQRESYARVLTGCLERGGHTCSCGKLKSKA